MAADESGWMPDVARVPTSAWGYSSIPEDGMYPQAIVCHVAQGYFSGLLNIARANQPGKSWHFSVGRDGEIAQHVSIWDPAYHAGIVADPQPSAAQLISRFGTNPNSWSIGIEQEGFSIDPGYGYDYTYGPAHPWPSQQTNAVIQITEWVWSRCQWLMDLSPAERAGRILTHSNIDQRTRPQDPGDYWRETVLPKITSAISGIAPPAYDLDGARADLRAALNSIAAAAVKLGG